MSQKKPDKKTVKPRDNIGSDCLQWIMRKYRRFMRRRGRYIPWKRVGLMTLMAAVFLYSTISLILYIGRAIDTRKTNAELAAIYGQQDESGNPDEAPAEDVMVQPTATKRPELLDEYQFIGTAYLPSMVKLRSRNTDLTAWIEIPEVVNLPVVYRDNYYYLDHDFYGGKNDSGTLFLDELHPIEADTQYLVIHGHDMYDGSMFGLVSRYWMTGYMEEHPTVYFSTLYRKEEYEIVGVMVVSTDVKSGDYVPYTGTRKFETIEHFYAFTDMFREHAMRWKEGVELHPTDALLALSTCYNDKRVVVVCRRVGIMG